MALMINTMTLAATARVAQAVPFTSAVRRARSPVRRTLMVSRINEPNSSYSEVIEDAENGTSRCRAKKKSTCKEEKYLHHKGYREHRVEPETGARCPASTYNIKN